MLPFYRRALLLLVSAPLVLVSLHAATPSRTPPSVYETRIAPLLTSAREALANRADATSNTEHNASILLREEVHYQDIDGIWYRVHHDISFAHNDSAQSAIGYRTYSYDKDRESIFLISARTHREDGSIQEVADSGAFIQAPQYLVASDLYTSQEALNLIFPSAQEGAATESIVLIRVAQPVWDDQFADRFTFDTFWPSQLARLVVDAPPRHRQAIQYP
ncbi:MAG: DUF3857 domain-containing protein [Candidatus Synoicihabitans palmerolidicus]|nr:DUF3857 domain-containing protein [Candidatus Synoicihabitans palmerolidicus]